MQIQLTPMQLKAFARYEISYEDLMQGREDIEYAVDEPYNMTLDDIVAALNNRKDRCVEFEVFAEEWFWPLVDFIDEESIIGCGADDVDYGTDWDGLPDDHTVADTALNIISEKYEYNWDRDLDDAINEITVYEANKNKPMEKRKLTKSQEWDFIHYWHNNDKLRKVDGGYAKRFREILDGLCDSNDPEALYLKTYACYGEGEFPYEQDWKASTDCLLKLMETAPDPQYANTLGYMYYYGRVNDGEPEYDKAFKYFSIGAAGGIYESRYKLADMFYHGYGVPKDYKVVSRIMWELYEDNIKYMKQEKFDCNFADIALRMGNMYRDGVEFFADPNDAFYYYLQAKYAIGKRMETLNYYGDKKVAASIDSCIAEVTGKSIFQKPAKTVHFYSLGELLEDNIGKKRRLTMNIKKQKDGGYSLTFKVKPYFYETSSPKLFITVPEAWYCGLKKKLTVSVKHTSRFIVDDINSPVEFDDIDGDDLTLYGEPVATIDGDFILKL